jgi:hypothetical protein
VATKPATSSVNTAGVSPAVTPRVPAMFTPWLDAFCVGGGSILLALVVIGLDIRVPPRETVAMFVVGHLINAPHFMVSYLLLYGDARRRHDYGRVSIYVPAMLLLWMLYGLWVHSTAPVVLEAMFGAASVLLAWHYTGQAWGMMAAFGFIAGEGFTPRERWLVRANLRVLLTWHVVWALVVVRKLFAAQAGSAEPLLAEALTSGIYRAVTIAAVLSSGLGLAGLWLRSRRLGKPPTWRVLLPWLAVHLWYVLLYRDPAAIFLVQLAHAAQYLVFPMRVVANRRARLPRPTIPRRAYMALYYALIVGLGAVFMGIVPSWLDVLWRRSGASLPVVLSIIAFINIHHYFIDNVIWKIRNPVVRDDLFSHLQPASRQA